MTDNENTIEEKMLGIAIMILCFCFGYWIKSKDLFTRFLHEIKVPFPFFIADGLIQIVTICLLLFVLLYCILSQFDK